METKTKLVEKCFSFKDLPDEIILIMLSHLYLNELIKISQANRQLWSLSRSNFLWKEKLKQHFPDIYKDIQKHNEQNYFFIFAKNYEDKYKDISAKYKKLYTLFKEVPLAELSKHRKKLKRLFNPRDIQILWSSLDWLYHKKDRVMSNYLYQIIKQDFLDKKGNIDISKVDKNFFNLLHWAFFLNQDIKTIEEIIKVGISPYQCTSTGWVDSPFHHAAVFGLTATITFLLDQLDKAIQAIVIDETGALSAATFGYGHFELTKLLLERGATVDIRYKYSITPLRRAIIFGHKKIVKLLLEYGASIDDQDGIINGTPLFMAASYGHKEIVKLLLEYGAKVDLPLRMSDEAIKKYIIELYHERESLAATKKFVEPKSINHISPLFIAIFKGHSDIVKLLLEYDANINQVTFDDKLPIHIAIEEQECEIIKMLLFAMENKFDGNLYDELNAKLTELAVQLTTRASLLIKLYTYINQVKLTKAPFNIANFFASSPRKNAALLKAISAVWKLLLFKDISELNLLKLKEKTELEKGELGKIYQQLIHCGLLDDDFTDVKEPNIRNIH